MDEEIQKPEPKISDVEIILIGVFYFGLDIMDFIPTVGDVTDVVAAPMGFYYWMKGLNGTAFIASEVVEAIPGAQELPFVRTITWGINIWLDRHPKLEAAFATVAALEGGAAALESGGVGEAGELSERGIAAETAESGPTKENINTSDKASTGEGSTKENTTAEGGRPSDDVAERDLTENKRASEREADQQRALEPPMDESGGGDAEDGLSPQEQHRKAVDDKFNQDFIPESMQDPIDVVKKRELSDNVVPITQEKTSSEKLDDRSARIAREQQKLQGRRANPAYEDPAA